MTSMTDTLLRDHTFRAVHLVAILRALQGYYVIPGQEPAISQRGAGANMSVDVGAFKYVLAGAFGEKLTTTNVVIGAADATKPRIDIIYVDGSGTIAVLAGTAKAVMPVGETTWQKWEEPYPADISGTPGIVLAEIQVAAGATSITNASIRTICLPVNIADPPISIRNPYAGNQTNNFKVQLHCHTTNSDGVDDPDDLMAAYLAAGFDAVAITDHDILTADPSISGIIYIPGVERSVSMPHLTIYDIAVVDDARDTQTLVNNAKSLKQLCSIAHPAWQNTLMADQFHQALESCPLREIYNGKTQEESTEKIDLILSNGHDAAIIAVDDCHDIGVSTNFNAGWVVVHAQQKTKSSILEAIKSRRFYASTGNDISIAVSGNRITASSAMGSNFSFIGVWGSVLKTESGVTSSFYEIEGDEKYVRVESVLASDSTKKAWSNPVWVDNPNSPRQQEPGNVEDLIDNGCFRFWQRGKSVTFSGSSNAAGLAADRFASQIFGSGTHSQITSSAESFSMGQKDVPNNPKYFHRDTLVPGTDIQYMRLYQRIEDITKIAGKLIHVGFWARASISRDIAVGVRQYFGSGGSSTLAIDGKKFSIGPEWTYCETTFTIPNLYGKTIGTTNSEIRLDIIYYKAGDSSFPYPSGVVGVDTAGTIDIAEVHAFEGNRELQYRFDYAKELRKCQRYCWKTFDVDTDPAPSLLAFTEAINVVCPLAGVSWFGCHISYPVPMASAPTVTFYNPVNANSNWFNRVVSGDSGPANNFYNEYGLKSCLIHVNTVSGDNQGNTLYIHALFSSELP